MSDWTPTNVAMTCPRQTCNAICYLEQRRYEGRHLLRLPFHDEGSRVSCPMSGAEVEIQLSVHLTAWLRRLAAAEGEIQRRREAENTERKKPPQR